MAQEIQRGDGWDARVLPRKSHTPRFVAAVSILLAHADELSGFDWSSLAPGSKVVDVGGGVGSTALVLAKEYPQLKVVVQDLPSTIAEAEKVCCLTVNSLIILTLA